MNRDLIVAILTRAVQTVAQAALAAIGSAALIEAVDWRVVASTAGLAGLLSLLKSIAVGVPEVPTSTTVAARLHALRPADPDDLDADGNDWDHGDIPDPADYDDLP